MTDDQLIVGHEPLGRDPKRPKAPLIVGAVVAAVALVTGAVIVLRPSHKEAAPPPPVTGPSRLGNWAGIATGPALVTESDADFQRDIKGIAATGVSWVRTDFLWGVGEPKQGTYRWDRYDRLVDGVRQHDLHLLGVVAYNPAWNRPAGTDNKYAPTDVQAYAAFAGAAAARYAPKGVHTWEIWNEPNTSAFWKPKPDPDAYV